MINIREFRREVCLSQSQLAELLKCQQPNISRLEKYHADLTEEQYEILFNVYGKDKVLKHQIDTTQSNFSAPTSTKVVSFVNEKLVQQNSDLIEIIKKQQEEIQELHKRIDLLTTQPF